MAGKYTSTIDREECIGDSLVTINNNFANLDSAVETLSTTSHAWVRSVSTNLNNQITWYSKYQTQLTTATEWLSSNFDRQTSTYTWVENNSGNVGSTVTEFNKVSSNLTKNLTWFNTYGDLLTNSYLTRAFELTRKKSINVVADRQDPSKNNVESLYSDYSSLLGGYANRLRGDFNILAGGKTNVVEGSASIIGCGVSNRINGNNSILLGGTLNLVTGSNSVLGGGSECTVTGNYSVVNGGLLNNVTGDFSGILGGTNNNVVNDNSFIVGCNITTTEPNTTYLNNLNIANTPKFANDAEHILVRSRNGNVGIVKAPDFELIKNTSTWTKGYSSLLLSAIEYTNTHKTLTVPLTVDANGIPIAPINIEHNLNTRNVIVAVYDDNTGTDVLSVTSTRTDVNNISISFSQNGVYKVVIMS